MVLLIGKILLSALICWFITYVITMLLFYVDLRITNPLDKYGDADDAKIELMKKRHFKVYNYFWLLLIILSLFIIF